ncbi:hypothetical protein [Clostridium estertheticum]|nr:hypothetical protein [Clostridium estertheticum]
MAVSLRIRVLGGQIEAEHLEVLQKVALTGCPKWRLLTNSGRRT